MAAVAAAAIVAAVAATVAATVAAAVAAVSVAAMARVMGQNKKTSNTGTLVVTESQHTQAPNIHSSPTCCFDMPGGCSLV